MFAKLQSHPFDVEAFFRRSLVLTYALPATALQGLVGPGLELDTYQDFAFLAVALVQTQHLRPKGFPRFFGRDFFLSGYRIFTRFKRPGHPELRGLKILRSDTDSRMMKIFGNVFTRYRYSHAEVKVEADDRRLKVRIKTPNREADLEVEAELTGRPAPLPESSPFRSLEDARHFAGPLPFTFSYHPDRGKMVIVKGIRKVWKPDPVRVEVREASFFEQEPYLSASPRLANAFYLENVAYSWMRGTSEDIA